MQLNGLSLAITNVLGGRLNPLSWFAAGEQGAWYDPSDLTTLFQDSAGTTPVTAVEQPVGLMLDKSRGLALGAELVTNGDFSNGTTGWTPESGLPSTSAVVSGALEVTNTGVNYGTQSQDVTTVAGKTYLVSGSYKAGTATAGVRIVGLPVNTTSSSSFVDFKFYFTATASTSKVRLGGESNINNGTHYYDNISVKQIAGNHAFQATAGKRPMLSARVNLLTYTEQIYPGNGSWSSGAAGGVATLNNAIAPNGALTATRIICDGTGANQGVYVNGLSTIGVIQTFGIYLKGSVGGEVINLGDASSRAIVTLTTEWKFYTNPPHTMLSTNNIVYSKDNTSSTFYIWGADLRPTNAGSLLPAYQRVNTASDYDTVGFPLYLKANGSSSAMSTNSIDFSSTDKMTVVTGVRKLSDTAAGNLLETGGMSVSNGCFGVYAPAGFGNLLNIGLGLSAGVGIVFKGSTGYAAPASTIVTGLFDTQQTIDADKMLMRVNGTNKTFDLTSGSSAGTGNFGNVPLYLFTRLGTSFFLNGNFYGAIIRGAQSDTASVTQTENYMAQKTGITF